MKRELEYIRDRVDGKLHYFDVNMGESLKVLKFVWRS